MARTNINVGTSANDGTGDTLRDAFIAVNSMTTEIYGDNFVTHDMLGDDVVDHDELAARYTAKQDISTTTGTINLDASLYAIFELTGTLGTVTLNIQNLKKGQVIDILLTGTLTSAVITLSDDFTTSQINKVGSTSLDTSKKNIIQVLCADDNDADAILNYAIATYAADDNPD